LDAGILLPEEPGGASSILERMRLDPSVSPLQIQDYEDRLRIALEDRGQQTILRYLEGDQIPQRKEDFLLGGRYFEEALHLAPDAAFDESRMLFCQGRALIFDHAYAAAQQLLERAIRIDPVRSYAYNALGIAYLEQIASNRAGFDLAIRAFHDAIRFAPNWAYPRHNLALAYSESGDYGGAEKTYLEAMQIGGSYSYLPYNLGLLYQKLNDYPGAERSYRTALEISIRNQGRGNAVDRGRERSGIENALGTVEAARGRADKAEAWYRKALVDDPESANVRHNLALLLSRSSTSAEAERLWESNLTADSNDLPSLMGYADYLAHTGQPDRAEELYGRVLTLRPEYSGARRKLAAVFLQQNQVSPALEQLRATSLENPGDAEVLEEIGDLENKIGDAAGAQRDWQAASKLASSGERRRILRKLQNVLLD
jgi:tetratricopeptide (TPR) repeat protein